MKARKTLQSNRAGFTLIEMLVVLAILVLLMSMVGPRILGSRKKADINTAKSQLGMFQASLETYNLDMKTYPETEQGLTALVETPAKDDTATKWDGPYITKSNIPKDPWGNDYQYVQPGTRGGEYDLFSLGADGQPGGEGLDADIGNWNAEE